MFELDAAMGHMQANRLGRVRYCQGGSPQQQQFFHLIHRALHHRDLLPDLAQIALHQKSHGQHICHITRPSLPPAPEPHRCGCQRQAHDHHGCRLNIGAVSPTDPHPGGGCAPLVQRMGQAFFFPRFCPKGLDHGIARYGIGQCCAHLAIARIGRLCRRSNVTQGQHTGEGDKQRRQDPKHDPHGRPVPAQNKGGQNQQAEFGQQHEQERVIQHIHRPHASCQPPYGGTGKGIGVPVGGQALYMGKGFRANLLHYSGGQPGNTKVGVPLGQNTAKPATGKGCDHP